MKNEENNIVGGQNVVPTGGLNGNNIQNNPQNVVPTGGLNGNNIQNNPQNVVPAGGLNSNNIQNNPQNVVPTGGLNANNIQNNSQNKSNNTILLIVIILIILAVVAAFLLYKPNKDNKNETSKGNLENVVDKTDNDDQTALSSKYVDYDNIQFSVNGKVYTLGKTTLQEMIDDGVPFKEDDIANAGNNLDKNTQSEGFRIVLGEYWTAKVYVMNDSDNNKIVSECIINEIYLPNNLDKTQNILKFSFPLNITEEDLKNQAGEPTEISKHTDGTYNQNTYKYIKKSTKYYLNWGYEFEFTNGKLKYVTLDYYK